MAPPAVGKWHSGRETSPLAQTERRDGTHEERRAAAAADAKRARPAFDELDRPGFNQGVKVLLKLVVGRKWVLDRVFLCQAGERKTGQDGVETMVG